MQFYLVRSKGFTNVPTGPARYGLRNMRLAALRGNHDHRNTFRVLSSGKLLDEFQTIHDRHVDVTQDQIDPVIVEDTDGLGPFPASNTCNNSRPDWRRERSTIFRMVGVSPSLRRRRDYPDLRREVRGRATVTHADTA